MPTLPRPGESRERDPEKTFLEKAETETDGAGTYSKTYFFVILNEVKDLKSLKTRNSSLRSE
jgi:hypothetical protein